MDKRSFRTSLFSIALPVTLQCLLQSSFSIADQIMVGQLGDVTIAAIGFAGKFMGLCTTVVNAVVTAASIMLSQYIGKKDRKGEYSSWRLSLTSALAVSVLFTFLSLLFPTFLMSLYSGDKDAIVIAASYLRIVSLSFIPMTLTLMASALLRCKERAKLPMYATFFSVVLNTVLNYIFIFILGRGAEGAAWATVISQLVSMVAILTMGFSSRPERMEFQAKGFASSFIKILAPVIVCEFLWSLGENIYGGVYGHIGTEAAAAMVLSYPIQNIMIGALTGISQASGIIIGKLLGAKKHDDAIWASRRLVLYGALGSMMLSVLIVFFRPLYLSIYNVSISVREMGARILLVYAFFAPVKVSNMILTGGIIRSGGRTDITGAIDITGTWLFGVPLALLSSIVFKLPIHLVYLTLSLEEVVRLILGFVVFSRKRWMKSL